MLNIPVRLPVFLVILVSAVTAAGALVLVGRVTRPLKKLSLAAQQMAADRWDEPLERSPTYSELDDLKIVAGGRLDSNSVRDDGARPGHVLREFAT